MKVSRDEFERGYARRSGVTVEGLRALGRVVRPCACDMDLCQGWQSVRVDPDDPWPADSPFPTSDPRFWEVRSGGE
jgi:hypothetical protein